VGIQRFTLKMGAAWTSETLVSYRRESIETQLDMTILADAVPQLLHWSFRWKNRSVPRGFRTWTCTFITQWLIAHCSLR